jgi:hypothetical protein
MRVFNRTRAHVPTCLYVLPQLAVKTMAAPIKVDALQPMTVFRKAFTKNSHLKSGSGETPALAKKVRPLSKYYEAIVGVH